MDIPWGDERMSAFMTNVGLITSDGPHGPNIMAAEWTHHISYAPSLIMVNVGPKKATAANIEATEKFGVSIAAADQNIAASVAGGSSGKDVDKIAVLRDLGFSFSTGKKTGMLLLDGAALHAECRLVNTVPLGDHIAFVGEVEHATTSQHPALLYHRGAYVHLGTPLTKPTDAMRERIQKAVEHHRKKK